MSELTVVLRYHLAIHNLNPGGAKIAGHSRQSVHIIVQFNYAA